MDLSSRAYQLVVIAKPSPDRPYCQLASAFQSCHCSQSILIPCLNALRLLSDESNRFGILQELEFAAEHEDVGDYMMLSADHFYQIPGRKEADVRFPYITATLVSSMASSCLDQEHAGYRCSLEALFHKLKNGVRAPGDPVYKDCIKDITVGVVDITDLSQPRYCFLNMNMKCVRCGLWWYDIVLNNTNDEVPPWNTMEYTPLSCEAITSAMTVDSESTVSFQREARDAEALEALRLYPLVEIAALASCWPAIAWDSSLQQDALSNQSPASAIRGDPKRGPRSLSKHAQSKTLDAILSELLDDLDVLNEPVLFRGLPQSFLTICAARVDELAAFEHQQTITSLLARLFEGADHVDLYPFRQLPMSTILQILHSDRLKDMKSLNLSGFFIESPEEIWTTLEAIPHQTEVVYLLSPPSADKASEEEAVMRSMPNYIGREGFWERMRSKKIIMSAGVSTALVSYSATHPSSNLGWKKMYLSYLRELVSGDTFRLQLVPHSTWFS